MSKSILSAYAANAIQILDDTVESAREDLNKEVTVMEITPDILKKNIPRLKDPNKSFSDFKAAFHRQNPRARRYTKDVEEITSTMYAEGPGYFIILARNFYSLRATLTKTSKDPALIRGALGIEKYTTKAGDTITRSKLDIGHTSETGFEGKDTVAGARIQLLADNLPAGTGTTILEKYLGRLDTAHKKYRVDFSKVYNERSEVNADLFFVYTVPQARAINAKLAIAEKKIISMLRKELADLQSSPSVIEIIDTANEEAFLYGKPKIKLKTKTTVKGGKRKAKPRIRLKAAALKTVKELTDDKLSTARLQTLINLKLHDQIKINMGKGRSRNVLNYRTGRFAKSAEAQAVVQSRDQYLDVYYTYQRFPYDTFLPGGRLYKPGRDPRKIIGKSIRQLATEFVSNNFKVNPILKGGV